LAKQKIVAGLLGLGLDEIVRRAERACRRRNRLWTALVGVLFILAAGATGGLAWARYEFARNEALLGRALDRASGLTARAVSLSDRYGVPRTVSLGFLIEAEGLFRDLSELGRDSEIVRVRKVWMLIVFARSYATLGKTDLQLSRAREAHLLIQQRASDRPDNPEWQHTLSATHVELGDALKRQGELASALTHYRASLEIDRRFASAHPDNLNWLSNLIVSSERMGDALRSQGNLPEAIEFYRLKLSINERVVSALPDNTRWLHGLSVSYGRIGDALFDLHKQSDALSMYRRGLAIAERVASTDPGHAEWQRNVGVSYNKIGDVLLAQGLLEQATINYRASRSIAERLAASDADNAGWQQDLAESYGNIADVLVAQGRSEEAIENYRSRLSIISRLARGDSRNANLQIGLAVSHAMIADVYISQGNLQDALASYRSSHLIWERIVETDPTNVSLLLDLLWSHSRLALFKDDAARRVEFILVTLRKLKTENKLSPQQELWLPFAEEAYAAVGHGDDLLQRVMLSIYWRTASFTQNPVRQYALVLAMLRKLKEQGKLTTEQANWLPTAEQELARLRRQGL
jgi:tetratricopeptide (TPR) repeat protein